MVSALASDARGPKVRSPLAVREITVSEHTFPSVICSDDTRYVRCPSDRNVNWMSPVQGKSHLVQVKEPYGNLDIITCRLSSATWSVQSTPADIAREGVRQYIEKESGP